MGTALGLHILDKVPYDVNRIIQQGFEVNQAWQVGQARIYNVP